MESEISKWTEIEINALKIDSIVDTERKERFLRVIPPIAINLSRKLEKTPSFCNLYSEGAIGFLRNGKQFERLPIFQKKAMIKAGFTKKTANDLIYSFDINGQKCQELIERGLNNSFPLNCRSKDPTKLFNFQIGLKKSKYGKTSQFIIANNCGKDKEIPWIEDAILQIRPLIAVFLLQPRSANGLSVKQRIKSIETHKAFKHYNLLKESCHKHYFQFKEYGEHHHQILVLVFVKKTIGAKIRAQIRNAYQKVREQNGGD